MAERDTNPFDTPIPGQSLTDTPKNYKWENPARFTKVEDAGEFILTEIMNSQETLEKIIFSLESGVTIEALTKTIIFSGFIEGQYSPDIGFLLTPYVAKILMHIGKEADIKDMNLTQPKKDKTREMISKFISPEAITKLKQEEKENPIEPDLSSQGLMSKPMEEN